METLEQSLKYQQWRKALEDNKVQIKDVTPLHLIHKPNGELLFAFVHINAQDHKGEKLLPIAFLRGHFVTVLTILIEQESGNKYVLLVQQYRIANGEYSYEHPAGMCDSQTDPYKVALKEVEEETGLKIEKEDLILLNQDKLFTSPGLLDEGGYFFCCEKKMPKSEIDVFRDKKTGAEGEREFIQTHICPIEEAMHKMSSAVSRLNLYMYLDAKSKA